MTLQERVKKIEERLDEAEDQWSYEELREIVDKTDLEPGMENQEFLNVGPRLKALEEQIERAGHTEFHNGPQTLEERLSIIEGMIDIFCSAHFGHTNFSEAEFWGMHEPAKKAEKKRRWSR